MSLKKTKAKKIPYYLLLGLLVIGASLIIGFLSFGGLYAIWPILPLAGLAMFLSVIYEGEIYLQNIKGALNKLFFKSNYLQKELANEFLAEIFPINKDDPTLVADGSPQFFKDYAAQLKLVHQFGHKKLDKESRQRKKAAEKKLRAMEKWFANQLTRLTTDSNEQKSDYQEELYGWLKKHKTDELAEWKAKLSKRQIQFNIIKLFSAISAAAMGLGTTYLLMGEFATIAFLAAIPAAALPGIIIPAAIIAGIAYGLLTYNAATDMVQNETIQKWWRKTKRSYNGPWQTFIPQALAAVLLISLAVVLTVCTAGTWWTVAKNARPIYAAMSRMPGFIMGIIVPVITGLSSLIFITQNTFETLEMFELNSDKKKKNKPVFFVRAYQAIAKQITELKANENVWQIINPFRILLKLTYTPLRLLAFAGHLISIGLTTDQVPGIPEIFSAILGILSEAGEDIHYFWPHKHKHINGKDIQQLLGARFEDGQGHSHENDIPTKLLWGMFWPLRWVSMKWDGHFSKLNNGCVLHWSNKLPTTLASHTNSYFLVNDGFYYINVAGKANKVNVSNLQQLADSLDELKVPAFGKKYLNSAQIKDLITNNGGHKPDRPILSKAEALEKHMGIKPKKPCDPKLEAPISDAWAFEENIDKIERFKTKHLASPWINTTLAKKKHNGLTTLQNDLREIIKTPDLKALEKMQTRIKTESGEKIYREHRYGFWAIDEKTASHELLDDKLSVPLTA